MTHRDPIVQYIPVTDPHTGKLLFELDVKRGLIRIVKRRKERTIDLVRDYGLVLGGEGSTPKGKGDN